MRYQNNLESRDPEPEKIEPVGTEINRKASIDEIKEGNKEKEIIRSVGARVSRIVVIE